MKSYEEEFKKIWAVLDRLVEEREQEKKQKELETEAKHKSKDDKKYKKRRTKEVENDEKRRASQERMDKYAWKTLLETQLCLKKYGMLEGKICQTRFYSSLLYSMSFGGISFDEIIESDHKSITLPDDTLIEDEFDIIMTNKDTVMLLEIKYKAEKDDVNTLLYKKFEHFKILYPEYKGFNFMLALGALYFEPDVEPQAIKKGIGILRCDGGDIFIEDGHVIIYK